MRVGLDCIIFKSKMIDRLAKPQELDFLDINTTIKEIFEGAIEESHFNEAAHQMNIDIERNVKVTLIDDTRSSKDIKIENGETLRKKLTEKKFDDEQILKIMILANQRMGNILVGIQNLMLYEEVGLDRYVLTVDSSKPINRKIHEISIRLKENNILLDFSNLVTNVIRMEDIGDDLKLPILKITGKISYDLNKDKLTVINAFLPPLEKRPDLQLKAHPKTVNKPSSSLSTIPENHELQLKDQPTIVNKPSKIWALIEKIKNIFSTIISKIFKRSSNHESQSLDQPTNLGHKLSSIPKDHELQFNS